MMNGYCPPGMDSMGGMTKDVTGGQDQQALMSALTMLLQMMGGQAGQEMPVDDDPDPMRAAARQVPGSMY